MVYYRKTPHHGCLTRARFGVSAPFSGRSLNGISHISLMPWPQVGSEKFEEFAKKYFTHFKDSTVTSAAFRDLLMGHFAAFPEVQSFNWDAWYAKRACLLAGLPPRGHRFGWT
jgi:hypothetical protein